jgi:hypothetical protein
MGIHQIRILWMIILQRVRRRVGSWIMLLVPGVHLHLLHQRLVDHLRPEAFPKLQRVRKQRVLARVV